MEIPERLVVKEVRDSLVVRVLPAPQEIQGHPDQMDLWDNLDRMEVQEVREIPALLVILVHREIQVVTDQSARRASTGCLEVPEIADLPDLPDQLERPGTPGLADLADLPDHWDLQEILVHLERKVLRDPWVLRDSLERPAHPVFQVRLVPQDSPEYQDLQEPLEHQAPLGLLELQAHLDRLDLRVLVER